MTDYRTYLEAIGRKPAPPYSELRAPYTPGAVELPSYPSPTLARLRRVGGGRG